MIVPEKIYFWFGHLQGRGNTSAYNIFIFQVFPMIWLWVRPLKIPRFHLFRYIIFLFPVSAASLSSFHVRNTHLEFDPALIKTKKCVESIIHGEVNPRQVFRCFACDQVWNGIENGIENGHFYGLLFWHLWPPVLWGLGIVIMQKDMEVIEPPPL